MKELLKRTPLYTHAIAPLLLHLQHRKLQKSDEIYEADNEFWSEVDKHGHITAETETLNAMHYGYTSGIIAHAMVEHEHQPTSVLDIGSGFGYWLRWYNTVFNVNPLGVEIGSSQADKLKGEGLNVVNSDVLEFLEQHDGTFSTINAIGVMHHILPDERREKVLKHFETKLEDGGLIIIGGLFEKKQRQYSVSSGKIYKRCWSLSRWQEAMPNFKTTLYRNPSCTWRDVIPQNNILALQKK